MLNPLNPYYVEDEETGLGGHVLDFLSYFDRPRNAVAAGLKGLGEGDPLGGFYRGLSGQEDVSFGDLIGIERGRPEDDWATWLAKSGSRFILDAALDPLNVLFAPAKATGIVGRGLKAAGVPEGASVIGQVWKHLPDAIPTSALTRGAIGDIPLQREGIADAIFESGIGRRFWNRAPNTPTYGYLNDIEDAAVRDSMRVPIQRAVAEAQAGMEEGLKGTGFTPKDVFSRAEGIGPQDAAAQVAQQHISPLKRLNELIFGGRNENLDALGLDPHLMVNEEYVTHVPRKQRVHEIPEGGERVWQMGDDPRYVGKGPRWRMPQQGTGQGRTLMDLPYTEKAFDQPHAEIMSWRRAQDPDIGQLGMAPDIQVAVGKLADKRTGVKRLDDGRYIYTPEDAAKAGAPGDWRDIFRETIPPKETTPVTWFSVQDPTIGQLGMAPEKLVARGGLGAESGVTRAPGGIFIHKPSGLEVRPVVRGAAETIGKNEIRLPAVTNAPSGVEVFPVRAALEQASEVMPKGTFDPNPVSAFKSNLDWMDAQNTFLKMFKPLRERGDILNFDGPDSLKEGYRVVNLPNMGQYQVREGVANWLENKAKRMWDKNTPGMWDEELLNAALNTKAGRALTDVTGTLKRWMLLDPSWMAANAVSGVQQQGLGGVPLSKLLNRNVDAIGAMLGREALPGIMGTEDFMTEMAKRGAQRTSGLWDGAMREGVEHGARTKAVIDKIADKVGVGEWLGDAAQTGMKFLGDNVDRFFRAGGKVEDQGKLVVAINKMKEKYPNFANLNETDKIKALDDVANEAKKVMFDYSRLTPYERNLTQIVPFYAWMRNITGATGKMAYERPDILAKYGRGLDTALEPMPERDKDIADDWVRQSGPIYGAMGTRLGKDPEGRDMMGLAARYLPHGQLEALTKRPGESLLSMVNPLLKMPVEIATNKNFFKNRPIDALAGPLGMFTNPITGGAYDLGRSKILGRDVPASVEYLAGVLPGGRQLRQLDTWGRGLGWWDDPGKGPIEPGDAAIWSLSGGKAYPFDRDRALMNRQREEKAAEGQIKSRMRFANKRGDMSQYEYYMQLLQEDMMRRQELRRTRWGQDAV